METAPDEETRVVIADGSAKVRGRLRSMLSTLPNQRIADVANVSTNVLGTVEEFRPDILILDIQVSNGNGDGNRNGIDLVRRIQTEFPDTSVIVLTNKVDRFYRRACLNAGARFFIDKSIEFEKVRDAVRVILSAGA